MRRLLVFGFLVAVMGVGCVTLRASNPADVNRDGIVNMPDIAVVCDSWLWESPPDPCEFALIPGGTFQMGDSFNEGDSDERPVHTVTVDAFYLGKYEITNQQYCDFLNAAKSQNAITVSGGVVYKAGSGTNYPYCDTHARDDDSQLDYASGQFSVRSKAGRSMASDPMVEVSWYGAVAYCNWRSQVLGKQLCYSTSTLEPIYPLRNGVRLPTEAEWEYAARGGLSGMRFPWGNTITCSQANYWGHPTWNDGVYPYTSPAGSFPPNGYSLYDMAGNVWEWCNDWYSSSYYSSSPSSNPTGPPSGSYRVLRGGGWHCPATYCRAAFRNGNGPDGRGRYSFGFRVALDF